MFYVRYVEGCSPSMREFSTKEDAAKFVANFKLKYQGKFNEDDSWIEVVFEGKLIYTLDSITEVG